MTYSYTKSGQKAHILKDGAIGKGTMKTLCGMQAHDPISASEKEIQEAERNLCQTCKEKRRLKRA